MHLLDDVEQDLHLPGQTGITVGHERAVADGTPVEILALGLGHLDIGRLDLAGASLRARAERQGQRGEQNEGDALHPVWLAARGAVAPPFSVDRLVATAGAVPTKANLGPARPRAVVRDPSREPIVLLTPSIGLGPQ